METTPTDFEVRAFYRAVSIGGLSAPYNTATLKVYYPALFSDTEDQRNSGLIAADPAQAPFPVLIMMPGINVGPEAYGWLAQALARRGIVTVTYSLVSEDLPGMVSISPGIDLQFLQPDTYRKAPSATALAAILEELQRIQDNSVLQGLLKLDEIILGGHSAGGTVALLNADRDWFPGLAGVFSFASHTAAATSLGWPQDSYLATPSQLPTLLLGGEYDGVIEGSQQRYGSSTDNASSTKLLDTFEQAIHANRGDCYLAIIAGANHFAITYPEDNTTGRAFLEKVQTRPAAAIRQTLEQCLAVFIQQCCGKPSNPQALLDYLEEKREQFSLTRCK